MAKMAKRVIQQRLAIGPETFEVIERVSHALGDHFQRGVSDTLDFEDLDGFTQDFFTLHGLLLHFPS